MSHRKGRPVPLNTSIRSVEEVVLPTPSLHSLVLASLCHATPLQVVVARRMFAHDILRSSLAPSPSPGNADKDTRRLQHKFMSDSNRAGFSPSSTASTVARAGDGFGRGLNLLGSFNSTTGDYSPPSPANQAAWPPSSQGLDASGLRSDGYLHASSLLGHDDDADGARGSREEVLAAKLNQLQGDKAAMAETIRLLQSQLAKRPKSPPTASDKSALLPRMIKDRLDFPPEPQTPFKHIHLLNHESFPASIQPKSRFIP
jgi:hypothetical protein